MAYEEKIREIIDCQRCSFPESVRSSYCGVCYNRRIAVQMAEWKDEQALRAFCRFQCPDIAECDDRRCESRKMFEKYLKENENKQV